MTQDRRASAAEDLNSVLRAFSGMPIIGDRRILESYDRLQRETFAEIYEMVSEVRRRGGAGIISDNSGDRNIGFVVDSNYKDGRPTAYIISIDDLTDQASFLKISTGRKILSVTEKEAKLVAASLATALETPSASVASGSVSSLRSQSSQSL